MRTRDIVSFVLIVGWALVAAIYRDSHYDNWALFASTAALAGTLAFYRWQPSRGNAGYRLLGITVCGQSFISGGMSVLMAVESNSLYVTPRQDAFSAAVWSTMLFSFLFLVGAFITAPRANAQLAEEPSPTTGTTPGVALALAIITTLVNLAYLFSPRVATTVGTLPMVLFNTGSLAPMLVAQATLTNRKSLLPLAVMFAGQAATTFYTSLLGAVVLMLRDMVLARIYLDKKLPKAVIAAMLSVVLVLNPAKALFRAALAAGPTRSSESLLDFGQTSALWGDAVMSTWAPGKHSSRERSESFQSTASRLNYNWVSAHVFSVVPYRVPFQSGATYSIIPAVLVPRILYPDKPNTATYGRAQWFIKLGIQDRESVTTAAFALPAPAEAYWNYGWAGLFFVPVLIGLATGLLLRTGPRDPVARVGYLVLLATSLGQFVDMVVWIIPNFIVVAAAGATVALYCRLGRGRLLSWGKPTGRRLSERPAIGEAMTAERRKA